MLHHKQPPIVHDKLYIVSFHNKLYNNRTNKKVYERNQFNVYQQGGNLFCNSKELLLLQSLPNYPAYPTKK